MLIDFVSLNSRLERNDRLSVGWLWEGYRESRRSSRDTYPESYITKYTSIRRKRRREEAHLHPSLPEAVHRAYIYIYIYIYI